MAGKVHTDSEALYAVRAAIIRFADGFQNSQSDFAGCFENLNNQIGDYKRNIDISLDELSGEVKKIECRLEEIAEQKRIAGNRINQSTDERTDTFACDTCSTRMKLKIIEDTTPCKSGNGCNGTMYRIFNNSERLKSQAVNEQILEKEKYLLQVKEDLQKQHTNVKGEQEECIALQNEFLRCQAVIMSLMRLDSSTDVDSTISFIDNAIKNLDDYQAVTFDNNTQSEKNTLTHSNVQECNLSELTEDIQKLLVKEIFSDEDRAAIRTAIMQGSINEQDVRIIGARVREKYDRNIGERNKEFEYLGQKKRELAMRFNNAAVEDEREQIAVESLILKQRENQYKEKYSKNCMVKQTLEEFRRVGPDENDEGQKYAQGIFNSSKPVIEAINSIREYLPTDWVSKSNKIHITTKYVNRGYFNMKNGKPTIALSNAGSGMQRCAFHEMGHFFEEIYPEIRKLEYQFYNRRTAGEDLRWLGAGYSRSEVARYDNFVEPYMGKDYGNTENSGFEIFSMGMEAIFANSYNLSRDTEYQDLILGILVSV